MREWIRRLSDSIDYRMYDAAEPVAPKSVWTTTQPVREIRDYLGQEVIRAMHRSSPVVDWSIYLATWAVFVGLWWYLAEMPFGPLWCVALVVQSVLMKNGFHAVRHDMFYHRRIAGHLGSYLVGLLGFPTLWQPFSKFFFHYDHHVYGSWDLSEDKKQDLDRRWKRWFALTKIGMEIYDQRWLRSPDRPRPNAKYREPKEFAQRVRWERRIIRTIWFGGVGIGLAFWPLGTFYGFLLPSIVISPFVVALRICFQHGETDTKNDWHRAPCTKPNFLVRILFYNTLGDSHLVHHFLPNIPLYRAGRVADMIRPLLVQHGVAQRGFFEILSGWFIHGYPMASRWPDKAVAVPELNAAAHPATTK